MTQLQAETLAMRYTIRNTDLRMSYSAKRSHVADEWYVAEYRDGIVVNREYFG